ncbi:hypothetical protein [Roseisalinus antarcticus]|uniref:Uncharacterized protein n=1 Tax=Roseisalinus antarcticus TaxID=254357 RepID=A0A1Y5T455_9RHOB|nr:hypothetical protein [Roseisalinus antarcticus]SLN55432.1 hypothetical protein ROA7023_02522 [Roseisalinus antarcticus]
MRILQKYLPEPGWTDRHGAKVAGFLAGSLGTLLLTLFLVVVATGEGYNDFASRSQTVVYPNF